MAHDPQTKVQKTKVQTKVQTRTDLQNELDNTDEPIFSSNAMRIVIAEKRQRRAKNNLVFNCLVLDREAKSDELVEFLESLEKQKLIMPNNTRFQFVYRTKCDTPVGTYHWSTGDVRINDGKLEFYLIDAASHLPGVLKAFTMINTKCPGAVIRYSGGSMQRDGHNCATFAVDYAICLAKIDNLHDKLKPLEHKGNIGRFASYSDYLISAIKTDPTIINGLNLQAVLDVIKQIKYISASADFTVEFGPLFRNMQYLKFLADVIIPKGMRGNKTQSLEEYITQRNSFPQDLLRNSTEILEHTKNIAIDKKRVNIKSKAAQFLRQLTDSAFDQIVYESENSEYQEKVITQQIDYVSDSIKELSHHLKNEKLILFEEQLSEKATDVTLITDYLSQLGFFATNHRPESNNPPSFIVMNDNSDVENIYPNEDLKQKMDKVILYNNGETDEVTEVKSLNLFYSNG